ncbi:MAG: MFS transporter, partial [Acidilobaceae archaeon]
YVSFCLAGIGMGMSGVAGVVLASRIVSKSLAHTFSYTAASSTIGVGLGALIGGWIPVVLTQMTDLSLVDGYRIVLFASGLLSPLPALLILPRVREVMRTEGGETKKGSVEVRMPWGILARLLLINIIISLGAGMSIHIIDYYFVAKFKVTSGELGTVMGVQNLIMGVTMLLMPTLSSRVGGPLRGYILVAAPSIPLIVAMTLTPSYTIAATLYIVRSILMNVANPLYQAFERSLIPSEYRGRGASLISVAWQIPAGVGRYVGGHMMDWHIESPLLTTSALYALAFALLAILFPRHVFAKNEPRGSTLA